MKFGSLESYWFSLNQIWAKGESTMLWLHGSCRGKSSMWNEDFGHVRRPHLIRTTVFVVAFSAVVSAGQHCNTSNTSSPRIFCYNLPSNLCGIRGSPPLELLGFLIAAICCFALNRWIRDPSSS